MNILMIGPDIEKVPGGMATVIRNYLYSDLKTKTSIKYISSNIEGKTINKLIWISRAFLKFFINLKNSEIVHIHMAEKGSFYRKSIYIFISSIFKKKIIVHYHGAEFDKFYEESCSLIKKYIKFILNKVDINIALGAEWKEMISKYTNGRIEVLNNSVNTVEENMYNNLSKNITMLGRLEERKGTFDLLDIADELISHDNNLNIILAGDGDLSKVREAISKKKYKDNIKLLGWIDKNKRGDVLKDTLIFTLPSYNEGMPMAILEAMSFGIPLVVTNVGGIPSLVEDEENGFLINPGDKKSLKECILKLSEDKDYRLKISNNNYMKINEEFNLQKNIQLLYDLYKSLV
ncbi:Glycosyltransferase Gtf1 [bioreactor metagenome]|uniref:Glycosyltransferase Gtf1 n=1 Tax=bioreactor metagenome TaxID=1076179 RepID=A0A644YZG4_9ZZZZ